MLSSSFAVAAVVSLVVPSVVTVGTAHVYSHCGIPVYFASVAQNVSAEMERLPSTGYHEPYSQDDVGISIKLSPSLTDSITQFEFTWANGDISYDISNINGNPFASQGMQLTPSTQASPEHPTCQTVSCPAGQTSCSAAYNHPDDIRTMVCSEESDLTFTLCPANQGKRDTATPPLWHVHSHQPHARRFGHEGAGTKW